MQLVAKLGGYLGRNNDPPPGHQLLWQGYTVLQIMCMGFELQDDTGDGPDSLKGKGQG